MKTNALAWISTDEGLPREGKPVLIYDSEDQRFVVSHRIDFDEEGSWMWKDEEFPWMDITHWAYLPGAPGED